MAKGRSAVFQKNQLTMRKEFWPNLDENRLWLRKKNVGFTTIPRTLPLIFQIMDHLESGKPISKVYFALWCHVYDTGYFEIPTEDELALESGFSGQRAKTAWRKRMERLAFYGFIDVAEGFKGKFHHVLIYNPYYVIWDLKNKNNIPETLLQSLKRRMIFIGATELDTLEVG